jgi:ribosomal-protein-alanine N-acetyltransferase
MTLNKDVFKEFPQLETKRLILRCLEDNDANVIFNMRKSDRVNQFIPRDKMPTIEDARELIKKTNDLFHNQKGIGWAGFTKESKHLIGTCGFNKIDFENLRAEIGGELALTHWGKNFAIEAVEAIIHFGFHELKLNAIEAKVSPDNKSAIHVLTNLGFEKEAHFKRFVQFKNTFLDLAFYTKHRE